VDILIDAFRRVRRNGQRRARLSIVGNPAHSETIQQYKSAAEDLLSDGSAAFLPAVDRNRYASLLRGADLLVIPRPTSIASRAGFPYKLVECIASGTPVLVTRFGDVEEYFRDGIDCLMCDPDDADALATAIDFAIDHGADMHRRSLEGQRRVADLFSFDAVAAQLTDLLRRPALSHT
jgi:glycosyltransferase involved in cell wall biosynthesis